jgi:hypothetical protein
MTGTRQTRQSLRQILFLTDHGSPLALCVASAIALTLLAPAHAVVVIFDGFGDADRNNDGVVDFYDTDLNNSGTWNDADADAALIERGITEVTAATDPSDIGIIWSGIRSFDTAANIPKGDLAIINDSVAIGSESMSEIHNNGLALSVESRGGGSSVMGRFPQRIELGSTAGDRVVVSFDFRTWKEANIPSTPPEFGEFRFGLYEDTDNELGMTAPRGDGFVSSPPGATVEWGRDDGNWFSGEPGAEGDKGIRTQLTFGSFASPFDARLQWEYNLAGINGTGNNGRILEGTGVSDTPGVGGDTGTIASPANPEDGPGGIIHDGTPAPHRLAMEIVRLENGLVEVASFVDGVEVLRDDIKETDNGFGVLGPPPFAYDYVAFRNSTDFDYVIDNFMVEVFGSNEGLDGDYNGDGKVDAADYVVWRKTMGTQPEYDSWRANFGASLGAGAAVAAVPEPAGLALLVMGGLFAATCVRRRPNRRANAARA